MEKKGNKDNEKDKIEVNFGMGDISFGGLFKGLGNIIDLVSKLSEEDIERKGEIKGLSKEVKGIYGLRIRTLAGGKPIVETFGNIKETKKGPVVEEVREPMVDVFDEKDYILVIAEMPGVSEDKIKIDVIGDIVNLTASNGDRKYAREILLPGKVKTDSIKSTYKNGILEITLEKVK